MKGAKAPFLFRVLINTLYPGSDHMTKKIKESTVAGSVAVVPAPLGKMQKRAGSMFKGKKTKKKFYESPQFTSKQQVIDYFLSRGKTAPEGAAAWERGYRGTKKPKSTPSGHWLDRVEKQQQDREDQNPVNEQELQEQDVIIVPGQGQRLKPGLIMKDKDRTDHEVEMALSDLYQSAKNAKMLYDMIKDIPEEQGLDGWVQEKIIKASDYLNTVREYMEHKLMKKEGSAGAKIGAVAGAALTRSLPGAIRGAQIGSSIQDMFERDDVLPGGVLAGGMSNFEEGVAKGTLTEFVPIGGDDDPKSMSLDEFANIVHKYLGKDYVRRDRPPSKQNQYKQISVKFLPKDNSQQGAILWSKVDRKHGEYPTVNTILMNYENGTWRGNHVRGLPPQKHPNQALKTANLILKTKDVVEEGSLNEAQKFDFTSNKQSIMTFIDNVLKNKLNNRQFNPFYALIVGDPKIGGASKLGLTPEFAAVWKKYFQNPAFIGGAPEPWSQYDVGDKFPKATGDDRTLNFYITVDKEKNNVAKFINNINKLPSYLKPISDQYKTPIKFKTHSLLDSFIGHNDSLKVYYYDPKAKDSVVNATKQWLSDSSIATGSRSHEHGVDVKSGGGSFGQILSNHVYDSFTELIKNNGNKFTSEQYFTWLEQHLPALIKQVQQKQTQGVAEEQAPMFTPEEKHLDEKKDACYSKVKSRYKVWPSAYASGALVQCRKVGSSNWGNKSKK